MKTLKKKMFCAGMIALMGIVLFFVNMIQADNNSTITGLASGLIVISILKLIKFIRISKDPQLLKKFEVDQKEERFILIAEKSGRFTLIVTLLVEFVSMFILILINQSMIANVVSAALSVQILVYLITYYYFCKKY